MKMMAPEMEVIRFGAEDVIATSGNICDLTGANWSEGSYRATSANTLYSSLNDGEGAMTNYSGSGIEYEDGTLNQLDGIYTNERNIFTVDYYYHVDFDSQRTGSPVYRNWKTCTDETHHRSS